ncbi:tRNA-uridine aminocarboxypropyltransferase [Shewanella algidipiscicola]|nr:tRNA-uridine aminocarboxypropyltransferase [Shewanella algidipiscicola]
MSRVLCEQCQYPLNACLCAHIRPMSTSLELIVLQDPGEVKHAKNSVKLMKAVLDSLRVEVGETPSDFASLKAYLDSVDKPIYLLYPSEHSQSITQQRVASDAVLLLLDGTWRKAYKLLQLNPWLQQYPALHLELDAPSHYTIRKAKRDDSLSTLEAAALAIKAVSPNADVSPLNDALAALVEQRLNAMPVAVRARYGQND